MTRSEIHRARFNPRVPLLSQRAFDRQVQNWGKNITSEATDSHLTQRLLDICLAVPSRPYVSVFDPRFVQSPLYPEITSTLRPFAHGAYELRRREPNDAYFHTPHGRVNYVDQLYDVARNRQSLGSTSLVFMETEFGLQNRPVEYVSERVSAIARTDSFGLCGKMCTFLSVSHLVNDPGDIRVRDCLFEPEVAKSFFDATTLGDKRKNGGDINWFHKENSHVYGIDFGDSALTSELANLANSRSERSIPLAALMCNYYLGKFTHWVAILGVFHSLSDEAAAKEGYRSVRELSAQQLFRPGVHSLDQGYVRIAGDLSPWGVEETPIMTVRLDNFLTAWSETMGASFGINPAVRQAITTNLHIDLEKDTISKNYGVLSLCN